MRGDGGGSLAALLDAELTPYRTAADAIETAGPSLVLDARAYSVMALVLHELATNAAKYGALSRPGGKLAVAWTIDAGGTCDITWRESGGPEVRPPSRSGFGSVLIDRSIPYDLGGSSAVEYRPEGLRGHFRIPARYLTVSKARDVARPVPSVLPPALDVEDLAELCVMILEDQLVIAVGLEQILANARIEHVVTAGSESEALKLLAARTPDVAVLDINLGVGTSIAVAEELRRRNVPFLFATGYGDSANIPAQLKDVPVVRKPYEAASILASLQALVQRSS